MIRETLRVAVMPPLLPMTCTEVEAGAMKPMPGLSSDFWLGAAVEL